jgi:uncharacterized membrane protein YkvA (DUF1232 family)
MRVSFDLSENDLKYFRRVMRDVRDKAKGSSEDEIVSAARELLTTIAESDVPEFIEVRIGKLGRLIDMLEDEEWALSGKDRERVVRGMAYFAEPDDIIPDKVPVLGFLDDAIMVELVVTELGHELEAYEDFCIFREKREERFGADEDSATRDEWLIARRKQLHARMRRRRSRRRSRSSSGPSHRSPISLW